MVRPITFQVLPPLTRWKHEINPPIYQIWETFHVPCCQTGAKSQRKLIMFCVALLQMQPRLSDKLQSHAEYTRKREVIKHFRKCTKLWKRKTNQMCGCGNTIKCLSELYKHKAGDEKELWKPLYFILSRTRVELSLPKTLNLKNQDFCTLARFTSPFLTTILESWLGEAQWERCYSSTRTSVQSAQLTCKNQRRLQHIRTQSC